MKLKDLESLFGTKVELQARVDKLQEDIKTLNYYGDSKSVMVCSHNTILAIKMNGRYTHIVDTKEERNLKMLHTVDCHLSVPRYEPKSAKAWMKEDTQFNEVDSDTTVEKVLLSERELRAIVIEDKQGALEALTRPLAMYDKCN